MTSCFVCATLYLGRNKSTGTEPESFPMYLLLLRNDKKISSAHTAAETKKATIRLLRTIVVLTQTLQSLPDEVMMTMKLLYHEDGKYGQTDHGHDSPTTDHCSPNTDPTVPARRSHDDHEAVVS